MPQKGNRIPNKLGAKRINENFTFGLMRSPLNMKNKFSIGIIDDQRLFAESLATLIMTFDFIDFVEICDAPTENGYRIPNRNYDIILLDILMPYMNGFKVYEKIISNAPTQNVVFLSTRQDSLGIKRAIELNAFGYIFKNVDKNTLEQSLIRMLIYNKKYFFKVPNIKDENEFSFNDGTRVLLTQRELDFLLLLLQECTTKEMAIRMSISEHTIIGYRKILFQKLSVNNMIGLAKYALEIFS